MLGLDRNRSVINCHCQPNPTQHPTQAPICSMRADSQLVRVTGQLTPLTGNRPRPVIPVGRLTPAYNSKFEKIV